MLLPLTSTLLGPDRLGFSLFLSPPLSTALCPGSKVVLKRTLCDTAVPVCHYCECRATEYVHLKQKHQEWPEVEIGR